MQNVIKNYIKEMARNKTRRRRMQLVVSTLSLAVMVTVFWQLRIVGISMTGEALCGYLEHTHTQQCLVMKPVCGLEESEGHKHTDDCNTSERVQICQKEEHTHVEGECYVLDVSECGREEHEHGDACFEIKTSLTCGQEEHEGHKHTDDCKREAYGCGYEKEHKHTLLCYSDVNADLETASNWEKLIPALNRKPAEDLAMVARTQIGYAESQRNYKVAEDGETKRGYTRYGAWYGNPYGDWNAMFVSFCLNYAEHPAYETLKNSGAETMRLAAVDAQVYQAASGAVPYVGDLAFLDKDSNGTCDTVAIVSEREEGAMTLVEGDCGGVVAENQYSLDNGTILGYALLTPQTATTELTDGQKLTAAKPSADAAKSSDAPEDENVLPADEDSITVTFVIDKSEYTDDPGSGYTHVTVSLAEQNNPTAEGYVTEEGLFYTAWTSDGQKYKHKITGTGTLMRCTIPAGTTLAQSGYGLPGIGVTDIGNGNTHSYVSSRSWVTENKMICNADTVFTEDTTLYLSLYPSGAVYNLNWVCNCDGTDAFAGSHSVYYNLRSSYPSPSFALDESLAANYILSAEDVNRTYTGTESCNVGSSHNKVFTGWYLKNETTKEETPLAAGVPFLEEYVDPDNSYTVKVYAHWKEAEVIETVTATFVNGEEQNAVTFNSGDKLGNKLPAVTAPEDKIFLGWKIGDTENYANAETEITANTTYTAVFADKVTVTFINGTETVETRYLAVNTAVGELPEVTASDKSFQGWVQLLENGETGTQYLESGTVITGDATYVPVFTDLVSITFMNGGVQFGETISVPVGTVLWSYLPTENPDYSGDSEAPMEFSGWKINDTDNFVTEQTVAASGMVLHAAFEEVTGFAIYLHDIAPDGITDYETDGQDIQSQTALSVGMSLADALAEDPYRMLHDDALASDCLWYIKKIVDGQETYVSYDLAEQVTSDIHLYTFSYSLTLSIEEESAFSGLRNLFTVASAAEIQVNGNQLTLTLRQGEKPTAANFVVNGVDYTLYNWTVDGETLNIRDIIENGVTKNIEATSSANSLAITPSATGTKTINFYVFVDEQRVWVENRSVTSYRFANGANDGARWYIPAATLESVYGKYGFVASQLTDGTRYFPHVDTGYTTIWADTPVYVNNGVYFSPVINHDGDTCDVYYLPKQSLTASGAYTNYLTTNTFYSVTIQDSAGIYQSAGAAVPAVSYVLTGKEAQITLLTPVEGQAWKYNGVVLSGTDNGNGTTTYTIPNVTAPVVITSEASFITVSVRDSNNLLYNQGEERPCGTTGIGGAVTIAVKYNAAYGWLANGTGLTGGVISDDETTITFTFADLTQNVQLTPIALKTNYNISYSIGTLPSGTVVGSAPTILKSNSYEDTGTITATGKYIVLSPDQNQYTREGDNSLVTVKFKGWDANGDGTVDYQAGQQLTAADLALMGDQVALTAVWENMGQNGSVSFYINLELQVADFNGSTTDTPNSDFTGAVYGTSLNIDPMTTSFPVSVVLEGKNQNDTATIDAEIRTLPQGVSGEYNGANRVFTLDSFPNDENVLAAVRQQQAGYIEAFKGNDEFYDESDPTNVTKYRAEKIWDGYRYVPAYRIICAHDANGVLRYVPVDELTSENHTIRWYVFKHEGNGWHVDGVLVKKEGKLTVTKTFYGQSAAVESVKGNYSITVQENGKDSVAHSLNLNPASDDNAGGYTTHDTATDTYTWVIPLTTNKYFNLKENNYQYGNQEGENIATLAEYRIVNSTDSSAAAGRQTYNHNTGVQVLAKAYNVDLDYHAYQTVEFYNSYIPTNAMPISKVDGSGAALPGVTFVLYKDNALMEIWKDNAGIYYIYNPTESGITATKVENGYITVDSQGYALVMGLKDSKYTGDFTFSLVEEISPEGYAKIQPIDFTVTEDGRIELQANGLAALLPDGSTLRVTNTSKVMNVTVVKNWLVPEDAQPVKVKLTMDGTPLSGYQEQTLNADNNWTATWEAVPAYIGGVQANYSVRETWIGDTAYNGTVDDGYDKYIVNVGTTNYTYNEQGVVTAATVTVTNKLDVGGVNFTKVNESGVGLAGATFQLYTDEACTDEYGDGVQSDLYGSVNFGNMAVGTYYMKEVKAPDGYQKNDTVYKIVVGSAKTTITALGSDTPISSIVNVEAIAELKVQKVDGQNQPLTGAKFQVFQKTGKTWTAIERNNMNIFEVDTDGRLTVPGLTPGDYKLVEYQAPAGYYRMTEEIEFNVALAAIVARDVRTDENGNRVEDTTNCWSFDGETITVTNVTGSELPHTGGMGTHFGTMAGLLLMLSSLMYGFLLRRKRERGAV